MYHHRTPPSQGPGAFWIRIALLVLALLSVVLLQDRCSSGVVDVFQQVAPTSAPNKPGAASAPSLGTSPGLQMAPAPSFLQAPAPVAPSTTPAAP